MCCNILNITDNGGQRINAHGSDEQTGGCPIMPQLQNVRGVQNAINSPVIMQTKKRCKNGQLFNASGERWSVFYSIYI